MDELIAQFHQHKILIDIQGASEEELDELENVIEACYVDGMHLREVRIPKAKYLHGKGKGNSITYSKEPMFYNSYEVSKPAPFASYIEFIKPYKDISEEELLEIYTGV